jgi:hypothetical protein
MYTRISSASSFRVRLLTSAQNSLCDILRDKAALLQISARQSTVKVIDDCRFLQLVGHSPPFLASARLSFRRWCNRDIRQLLQSILLVPFTREALLALVGQRDLRVRGQFYAALGLLTILPGLDTITRKHRSRMRASRLGGECDGSREPFPKSACAR